MTREEVYGEIEAECGVVPAAFRNAPDEFVEQEWHTWKRAVLDRTRIPAPWKDLVCLSMAVASADPYGVMFWRELAQSHGATEEQLQEVAYLARLVVGFGPYMRANEVDYAKYEEEVADVVEHTTRRELKLAA